MPNKTFLNIHPILRDALHGESLLVAPKPAAKLSQGQQVKATLPAQLPGTTTRGPGAGRVGVPARGLLRAMAGAPPHPPAGFPGPLRAAVWGF